MLSVPKRWRTILVLMFTILMPSCLEDVPQVDEFDQGVVDQGTADQAVADRGRPGGEGGGDGGVGGEGVGGDGGNPAPQVCILDENDIEDGCVLGGSE